MQGITFGSPVFRSEAGQVEPDAEVHFSLLLVLSASDPAGLPRDELATLLWPNGTLDAARHSLRQTMYRLRQLGMGVAAQGGLVSLRGAESTIDLRHLMDGTADRNQLAQIGTHAFLPGFAPQLGAGFTQWLDDLRDRVDRVRRRSLVEAVRDARSNARFADIHRLAPALLALDPLNETATLCLAEALVMDGSKVEAVQMLEAYEAEVGRVSDELRIPARTLRRRVSESLDDSLLPRKFEVPFVGRESEFRVLRHAFLQARGGAGQCALITGEPGIGKTRIATELLRVGVLDGSLAVTYNCTSGDAITPLSSLLGLVSSLLCQPGALGCAQEHLQYMRRVVNPEPGNPVAGGMSADVAYAQLVYSMAELTAAVTDEAPLMVFVDDAHRLHQTSWRIFTDVAGRLPDKRLLLIFAARQLPEWYHTLGITGTSGRVHQVRMVPFAREDSQVFLDRWSSKNAVCIADEEAVRFSSQSGGNPFYLGELAAHRARDGGHAPPPTIRALIEQQFSGLTDLSQRVLLVVSLLQSRATIDRVTTSLGVQPLDFLSALNELEQAGLVAAEGTNLRLKHDLVAEVTQAQSTRSVLTYLRTRGATVLEVEARETSNVDLLSDAVLLWEQSGDVEKTVSTSMLLGDGLLELGLTTEAAKAYAKAREYAEDPRLQALASIGESRAMYQGNNWAYFSSPSASLRSEVACQATSAELSEFELSALEARYVFDGVPPDMATLANWISDSGLDLTLRSRAATLALIFVDNSRGAHRLDEAESAVSEFIAEFAHSDAALVPLVVHATHNGQKDAAIALAERLLRQPATPAILARRLRYGAHALIRAGQTGRGFELFNRSYVLSAKLRLPLHQVACVNWMARIAAHCADEEMGETTLSAMRSLSRVAHEDMIAEHYLPSQATMAWLLQDRTMATDCLAAIARRQQHRALDGRTLSLSLVIARGLTGTWTTAIEMAQHALETIPLLDQSCADHLWVALTSLTSEAGDSRLENALAAYFTKTRAESTPVASPLLKRLKDPWLNVALAVDRIGSGN